MSGNITSGMDIGEVRQLSSLMTRYAGDIRKITSDVTGKLHNVAWKGNDRNRFEQEWTSQHVQQLNTVIKALEDAARLANQNANEQDTTSR